MSSDSLLIALVLFVASIAWVAFPLLRSDDKVLSPAKLMLKKQHDRLTTRYAQVLSAIRDMDEDHMTGKINTGDYERERRIWTQRGVEVLKQLDELEKSNPDLKAANRADFKQAKPESDEDVDDAIESAVADYLKKSK